MIKEKFLELCKEHHLIGSNFVVANDKEILETASYGLMDKENNKPYTDDTITRIASISKTVLSIALMQLYENGKIDLKEDISKYLGYLVRNPYYPNDKITVEMITTQTSSILDGYDDENPKYDNIIKGYNGVNTDHTIDVALKDLLTNTKSVYYTMKTWGKYKPGTRFNYSNFGCGIMACIIEKVSGEYYVEYIENHVFKPLRIVASYKASRLPDYKKIATMYSGHGDHIHSYTSDRFTNSPLKQYPLGDNFRGPAGGCFISMVDLAKIMQLFLNYGTLDEVKILERETVELMYQQHWCGSPVGESYRAKGIQMKILDTHPGFPLRGHTGGAYGVRSYMFFDLKHKIGGCFITNGIDSVTENADCQAMFTESQNLFLEEYANYLPSTAIIKETEITLDERSIIDEDMFYGKFIKGMHFSDLLASVGHYNEDLMSFELTFKDITYNFKDILIYKDIPYVNLEEGLKAFNITYETFKDYIKVLY